MNLLPKIGFAFIIFSLTFNPLIAQQHAPDTAFVKKAAPSLLMAQNWTLAEATQEVAQKYNSKGYPDIYYLISPEGKIVNVAGSPGAHMKKIIDFAGAAVTD